MVGCNGIGSKDTIVARIGNETLYQEDLDFIVLQGMGNPSSAKYRSATDNLLYSLANVSRAESEANSYDSAWSVYEPVVENRLLMIAYIRFHLQGRLGYTDEELKRYFDEHRSEFDSLASYFSVREEVASRYYISKNQDSLKKFIQQKLPENDEPAKVEAPAPEPEPAPFDFSKFAAVKGSSTEFLTESSAVEAYLNEAFAKVEQGQATSIEFPGVSSLFELASADLSSEGRAVIAAFGTKLAQTNMEASVLVEGYTCDLGNGDGAENAN